MTKERVVSKTELDKDLLWMAKVFSSEKNINHDIGSAEAMVEYAMQLRELRLKAGYKEVGSLAGAIVNDVEVGMSALKLRRLIRILEYPRNIHKVYNEEALFEYLPELDSLDKLREMKKTVMEYVDRACDVGSN